MTSRPKTQFPGPEINSSLAVQEDATRNRHTRFPGGLGLQPLSMTTSISEEQPSDPKPTKYFQPLKINPPEAKPTRPLPTDKIESETTDQIILPIIKNPFEAYTDLRLLQRGNKVTAACTKQVPTKLVTIQKLSSGHLEQFKKCKHDNLLQILEVYRHHGQLYVVTDYTVTTLRHIIAVSLQLQEIHVSATCHQVFEGMQYLSRFGIAHKRLNSSKILFSSDGCIKIAHFDDCQSTETASARPLGIIALEMMQKGIAPAAEEKLRLNNPERWSPEGRNFIAVASWATLKEIQQNRFLKDVSPTTMIPFIEHARWETLEDHYLDADG